MLAWPYEPVLSSEICEVTGIPVIAVSTEPAKCCTHSKLDGDDGDDDGDIDDDGDDDDDDNEDGDDIMIMTIIAYAA